MEDPLLRQDLILVGRPLEVNQTISQGESLPGIGSLTQPARRSTPPDNLSTTDAAEAIIDATLVHDATIQSSVELDEGI